MLIPAVAGVVQYIHSPDEMAVCLLSRKTLFLECVALIGGWCILCSPPTKAKKVTNKSANKSVNKSANKSANKSQSKKSPRKVTNISDNKND